MRGLRGNSGWNGVVCRRRRKPKNLNGKAQAMAKRSNGKTGEALGSILGRLHELKADELVTLAGHVEQWITDRFDEMVAAQQRLGEAKRDRSEISVARYTNKGQVYWRMTVKRKGQRAKVYHLGRDLLAWATRLPGARTT